MDYFQTLTEAANKVERELYLYSRRFPRTTHFPVSYLLTGRVQLDNASRTIWYEVNNNDTEEVLWVSVSSEERAEAGTTLVFAKDLHEALYGNHPSLAAKYNLRAAWQFLCESYDNYSPIRAQWTDEQVVAFAAEHHVLGSAAFLRDSEEDEGHQRDYPHTD